MCGLFGGGTANMTNQQKADDAMGSAQIAGKNLAAKGNYKVLRLGFSKSKMISRWILA